MMGIMPYLNWSLIALLLGVVAFQIFRLNRLEDKVRRLDSIVALHLELDPQYTNVGREHIVVDAKTE